MFDQNANDPNPALNDVINKMLLTLDTTTPGTDEYGKMTDHLSKLFNAKKLGAEAQAKIIEALTKQDEANVNARLKEDEIKLKAQETEAKNRLSKDTVAVVAANLVGIVLIIGHEKLNTITSKALGFVPKIR